MKRLLSALLLPLLLAATAAASGLLPAGLCRGSRMPYPAPDTLAALPDTLVPVMINHVGRHGARYATSPAHFRRVEAALSADSAALTPLGRTLLDVARTAIAASEGRWGRLDSLGVAEQQGIAARLCDAYPGLVVGRRVTAISSYVGRCVASMNAFTGVVRRMQSGLGSVIESSGRRYSPLLRPFDTDSAYRRWSREKPYLPVYTGFRAATSPDSAALAVYFKAPALPADSALTLWGDIYYLLSSIGRMDLLTPPHYNALWRIDNLRQYLSRTASTVSTLPASIASDLLLELIETTDSFIAGREQASVMLRFGHAETLMPLLSLMRLPRCYYLTHYFDTVSDHWQTWHVVPMASNLQLLLLLNPDSGRHYIRVELNERPVDFGGGRTIIPYPELRAYWLSLIAS